MRAALAIALMLASAAAGVAVAQTPVPAATDAQPASADPIGDAIQAALPADQTTDLETDELPVPSGYARAIPGRPPESPPPPLVLAPSRRPSLDRPVMIDEIGVSPDGPPTPLDLGYESRIRASSASAQGLQGPLDGGWTVRMTNGAPVLALQLVDRGQGYGQLEGAWRGLDGPVGKVGLIDSLDRQPVVLTIRITRGPNRPTTILSLVPTSDGSWSGEIMDETGTWPVTMRRNQGR